MHSRLASMSSKGRLVDIEQCAVSSCTIDFSSNQLLTIAHDKLVGREVKSVIICSKLSHGSAAADGL